MAGPLLWTTSEPIYLCSNDNDEEDEVFFGPTSSAELRRRELLSNRRRTLLVDGTAVAACLAANRIQAWMRMLPLRQVFVAQRKAAQQVQQWWRLVRERSLRHRAATKIAATWRAHVARKQYARTLRTILFIQARWRFKTTLKKRSLQPATNDSQAASRRTGSVMEEKQKALENVRKTRQMLLQQLKRDREAAAEMVDAENAAAAQSDASRMLTPPASPPPEYDEDANLRVAEENTIQNSGYKRKLKLVMRYIRDEPPVVLYPQPGLIGRAHVLEVGKVPAAGVRGIRWKDAITEDLLENEPSESDLTRVPSKSNVRARSKYEGDTPEDPSVLPVLSVLRTVYGKEPPPPPVQRATPVAARSSAVRTPVPAAKRAPPPSNTTAAPVRQPLASAQSAANVATPSKQTPARVPTISAMKLRRLSTAIVPLRDLDSDVGVPASGPVRAPRR